MKKLVLALSAILLCALASGCLVRAVNPWLGPETRVDTPSLAGAWTDAEQDLTLFFTPGDETAYKVLAVAQGKDAARLTATLHKVDDTLLLVVGPEGQQGLGAFTLIPAHLLFRVAWQENAMQLFAIDLETAGARIAQSPVGKLAAGSKEKSYTLLAETPELTAFVKAQLKDPAFFSAKPLYQFKRVAGK